jgi:hypothetical protein
MTDRQPSPLISAVRQTVRRLVGLDSGAVPDPNRVPSRDRMEQVQRLPSRPTWYFRRQARLRWLLAAGAVALGFGLMRLLGGGDAAHSSEDADSEAAKVVATPKEAERETGAREASAAKGVQALEDPALANAHPSKPGSSAVPGEEESAGRESIAQTSDAKAAPDRSKPAPWAPEPRPSPAAPASETGASKGARPWFSK